MRSTHETVSSIRRVSVGELEKAGQVGRGKCREDCLVRLQAVYVVCGHTSRQHTIKMWEPELPL